MKNGAIYPDLRDKTVVITGAGQGIGEAIAKAFINQGSKVILVSRSKIEWLNISKYQELTALEKDIQEIDFFKRWLKKYASSEKKIDILINNAGVIDHQPLMQTTSEQWDKILNINSKATFFFTQLFAKHMIENNTGNILFASSFATTLSSFSYGVYAASKSMNLSLMKNLAAELAPNNIRVNAYSPGVIETKMTELKRQKNKVAMLKDIALNRFGSTNEVASGVLFLASDESSYLQGVNLDISGGKFITQNSNTSFEIK